ncbi:LysR family transcriptional regulator [Dyella sp.]|uniref:LysR family transcriptional regulator n=1 Tax=Dyella sp. TaxID=1869338 RepID=UPI00284FDC0D|nr:LysR family transcriptional regulator [Dyella sp.]MDR3446642.1 LysR family transcriptional regulator [Dyella sp.]
MDTIHGLDTYGASMSLGRFDLNLLRSLDVLLVERNVTRAAARLHLSQPALSSQLKQLRALFNDPLLVPSGPRGMLPTPRALALQESLRDYLAQLTALVVEQKGFDPAASSRTWRVSAADSAHSVVAPGLLRRLQASAPACRLALLPSSQQNLPELMSSNEIDLLLAPSTSMPESLKCRELYRESFVCVLRKGHPAAKKPLSLDQFCEMLHALTSPSGGGFEGVVDEMLAHVGRRRRVMVSTPSFLLLPSLVEASDLVATVPRRVAQFWTNRVALLAPPLEIEGFSMQMGWHPRNHADPGLRWLREQVQSVVAETACT